MSNRRTCRVVLDIPFSNLRDLVFQLPEIVSAAGGIDNVREVSVMEGDEKIT